MNESVRDYLIRAHNRVISHYHKLLQASSLELPQRERILQGLASTEAELDKIRGGASNLKGNVAGRVHDAPRPGERQRP